MNPASGDLGELIDLYLSGRASDQQVDVLTERMRSDEAARELYVEMADTHAQLAVDETLHASSVKTEASATSSRHKRRSASSVSRTMVGILVSLAAALLVALGLGVGRWMNPSPGEAEHPRPSMGVASSDPTSEESDDGVAVLTHVVDARWPGDDPPHAGRILSPGTLKLASGLIEIEFYNGVQLLVEGPADLEIQSVASVVCREGKLRSHVPPNATGFSVLTPKFELVDLGTEFAVDVSSDGRSDVHVFEGEVELYLADGKREPSHKEVLLGGNAMLWSAEGKKTPRAAIPESFTSFAAIRDREQSASEKRFENWRRRNEQMRNDPRVVAHYDFQAEDAILPDGSVSEAHGTIVGCEWTTGRWPGKQALEFKRPGDRVRIDVPGKFDSLTIAAWVRVDALPSRLQSLLLTDGFEVGHLHWQIGGPRGDLRISARISQADHRNARYVSPPVFTPRQLGVWNHVCSTYDRATQTVTHSFNGRRVFSKPFRVDQPIQIGMAEIGNWVVPKRPKSLAIRNFVGRMDELTIWNASLDEREIVDVYEASRP